MTRMPRLKSALEIKSQGALSYATRWRGGAFCSCCHGTVVISTYLSQGRSLLRTVGRCHPECRNAGPGDTRGCAVGSLSRSPRANERAKEVSTKTHPPDTHHPSDPPTHTL